MAHISMCSPGRRFTGHFMNSQSNVIPGRQLRLVDLRGCVANNPRVFLADSEIKISLIAHMRMLA